MVTAVLILVAICFALLCAVLFLGFSLFAANERIKALEGELLDIPDPVRWDFTKEEWK